jgi:hypothetical protein
MSSEKLKYDYRHGGPFDRGSADSFYCRRYEPHYYMGATGTSHRVTEEKMTQEELAEYRAGWEENEAQGNFKDYS